MVISYAGQTFQFTGRRDHIARKLAKGKFYEEKMLTYIRDLAIPGWYMDVGAFIGTHTVFFAGLCEACTGVIAFEPCRESFDCLVRNVGSNACLCDVQLRSVAVGAASGHCTVLEGPADNRGNTKVRSGGGNTVMVCLDDAVASPLGLVKIDVEGAEMAVLEGARKCIERHRPHLFVEAVKPDYRKEIEGMLADFGYRHVRQFNASPTHHFAP